MFVPAETLQKPSSFSAESVGNYFGGLLSSLQSALDTLSQQDDLLAAETQFETWRQHWLGPKKTSVPRQITGWIEHALH